MASKGAVADGGVRHRVSGMAWEHQSTSDSGVVIDGLNSSGDLREAPGTPRVTSIDRREPTPPAEGADVLPPSYIHALLALNINVVATIRQCLRRGDRKAQMEGARALREAARDFPDVRAALGAAGAARALLKLLKQRDLALVQEALQALINLTCDCPENRVLIPTASMEALDLIIEQLHCEDVEVQEKTAELVFSLSLDNSNKVELNHSGAILPLIRLLSGTPATRRVACKALFNISLAVSCRHSAIELGAVPPLLQLAADVATEEGQRVAEKALMALKVLSTVPEGWAGISGVEGWAQILVSALEIASPVAQEAAVAVLLELCSRGHVWKEQVLAEAPLPLVWKLTQAREKRLQQRARELQRLLTADR